MHDHAAIMKVIVDGYVLPVRGDHGIVHWARVLENGLRIAELTGADREVVGLFALFHDSRRINEYRDDGHGLRGAELARSLRGSLVHLDDARFAHLFEACRLHTDGHLDGDPTVQACWDADRLDLGRVGITPQPDRLCTNAARDLLSWSHARAMNGHVPVDAMAEWGVLGSVTPTSPSRGSRRINARRAISEARGPSR
jgi:uncharacterized protein